LLTECKWHPQVEIVPSTPAIIKYHERESMMMRRYDVIIIGAGPAGLECAKTLGGSKLRVLVIERTKIPCVKSCAQGLTLKDLDVIPKEVIRRRFRRFIVHGKETITMEFSRDVLFTIDRKALGDHYVKSLSKAGNVTVLTGTDVLEIRKGCVLSSKGEFGYRWLVGADGSTSIVRHYLGLPTSRSWVTLNYRLRIERQCPEFTFDKSVGYIWIFPNKGHCSVGCGAMSGTREASTLMRRFHAWLDSEGIAIDRKKLEGGLINFDYRGTRFGDVFLAGDAAGLASGLTGEGIYPAIISGRHIGKAILSEPDDTLGRWLTKKRKQDHMLSLWRAFRWTAIRMGMKVLKTRKGHEAFERLFCRP
jgi:flavin-dependent dehydrogenase